MHTSPEEIPLRLLRFFFFFFFGGGGGGPSGRTGYEHSLEQPFFFAVPHPAFTGERDTGQTFVRLSFSLSPLELSFVSPLLLFIIFFSPIFFVLAKRFELNFGHACSGAGAHNHFWLRSVEFRCSIFFSSPRYANQGKNIRPIGTEGEMAHFEFFFW